MNDLGGEMLEAIYRGRRAESQRQTRAKVREAARVCFSTLGYEKTTTRDIARTAGMSTGAIFANFSDKASLYREVMGVPIVSPEQGAELLAAAKEVARCDDSAKGDITMGEYDAAMSRLRAAISNVEG